MENVNVKITLSTADAEFMVNGFQNVERQSKITFGISTQNDRLNITAYKGENADKIKTVLSLSEKNADGDYTKLQLSIHKNDLLRLVYNAKFENPELFGKLSTALEGTKLEINKSDELYLEGEYSRRNEGKILLGAAKELDNLRKIYPELDAVFTKKNRLTHPDALTDLLKTTPNEQMRTQVLDTLAEADRYTSIEIITQLNKGVTLGKPMKGLSPREAEVISDKMTSSDFLNAMVSDKHFATQAKVLMEIIMKAGDQIDSEAYKATSKNLEEQFKKKTGYSIDL